MTLSLSLSISVQEKRLTCFRLSIQLCVCAFWSHSWALYFANAFLGVFVCACVSVCLCVTYQSVCYVLTHIFFYLCRFRSDSYVESLLSIQQYTKVQRQTQSQTSLFIYFFFFFCYRENTETLNFFSASHNFMEIQSTPNE